MNTGLKKFICFLVLLLPIVYCMFHYLYLKPAILFAYNGHPDNFVNFLTENFYPRFTIEKERFDITFFLAKADQVLYRFSAIYYLVFLLIYLYNKGGKFKTKISNFFHTETTSKNIDILRVIYFSYFLYLIGQLCHDLIFMQPLMPFYKPVLWLRLFNIPFPEYFTILIIAGIWYSLTILILLNIRIVLCTSLSLFIFILVQCWEFSFEKLDHSYATITYAFMLLPFLFDEQKRNTALFNSWSLQLIRISIAMVYFLSSLEKIFIARLSWLKPETLKTYLSFHETQISKIIIQYDFLCILISAGSLLIQLSFILILFLPRWKWLWMAGGIAFHTGTLLIMNIGHPLNPWLLVYIFFIDWTKVYNFVSSKLKKLNFLSS